MHTSSVAHGLRRRRDPVANRRKADRAGPEDAAMTKARLTITSKNYSSWSLRGWLLARFAGLDFEERLVPADDPAMRAELLLLSSSILVPCLDHDGISVWDTLAIGEYLNDVRRAARLLPANLEKRTRCRSVCGEMHSGFSALRSSLPMNLIPGFKVWSRAQADIDRISTIWNDCLSAYGGPFLFGERSMADAMYARSSPAFAPTTSRSMGNAPLIANGSWKYPRWSSGSRPRAVNRMKSRNSRPSSNR
jgi:glutathione S-transferase